MKYYRLEQANGNKRIVSTKSDIDCIRKFDLASADHLNTKIIDLGKDQLDAVTQALEINN